MKRILLFLLLCTIAYGGTPPKWLQLPGPGVTPPRDVSGWVLYDSLTVIQESAHTVVRRHRYAVMPLSDAGVKSANCFEQYIVGVEDLISAKAWIMSPDGKKFRAFGGSEFLAYSPTISRWTWDQTTSAYFNPERYLEPGWIFAWEVEIRSKFGAFDFSWMPESSLPVRYASLEICPVPNGEVKWKTNANELSHPIAGESSDALLWSLSDIPPFKGNTPEDMARVFKEVRAYSLTPRNNKIVTKTWADVVRQASAQVDPQKISSPALEAEAKQRMATGDMWERIAPICRFVQKEIAYLSVTIFTDSMAGYRPHAANEVFENRYGDCKDKALLLCTMLQAVGVEARLMLVNYGDPKHNSLEWPSARFNHAIVAIRASDPIPSGWTTIRTGGLDYVLFDPTDDQIPLGLLPFGDTYGLGLVLAPTVDAPVTISPVNAATDTVSTIINYHFIEDGSATIDFTEERAGSYAVRSNSEDETSSLAERTEALERRIRRHMPVISALTWKNSNDTKSNLWKCTARFDARFVAKPISRLGLQVTPDLLSGVGRLEPWEEGSDGWFALTPRSSRRELHLTLPTGWEFAEVPKDWSITNQVGEATIRYRREGTSLIGEIHLALNGGILDRTAYLAARELLRDVISAERRPVVLNRVLPATAPAPVKR